MEDKLKIGDKELDSRLFIGTGKFADYSLIPKVIKSSKTQVVTVALRRVDFGTPEENMLTFLPKNIVLMPNTSGARNAPEAIRIARIARAAGCGNWVKIEIINDQKYLLPDNFETIKAIEVLAKEGFIVLPYMSPDLTAAKMMAEVRSSGNYALGCSHWHQPGPQDPGINSNSHFRDKLTHYCRCRYWTSFRGCRSDGNGSGSRPRKYGNCYGR